MCAEPVLACVVHRVASRVPVRACMRAFVERHVERFDSRPRVERAGRKTGPDRVKSNAATYHFNRAAVASVRGACGVQMRVWSPSEVGFIAPMNLRSRPPGAHRGSGTPGPGSRGPPTGAQRFEASVLRRPLRCICATPGLLTPASLHSQAPFTRAPPTSPQCHLGAS